MKTFVEQAGVLGRLPSELHYLIEPVLRCGCNSKDEALAYANKATAEELNDLARIATCVLVHDHYPAVGKFLERYPMSRYPECAKLYYFFAVLDQAGLEFDELPDWIPVDPRR
jgi:hypothetical protein